jgi:hypothetical protein
VDQLAGLWSGTCLGCDRQRRASPTANPSSTFALTAGINPAARCVVDKPGGSLCRG